MRRLLKFILRQQDIGQWWGGFRHVFSNATMFVTLFNTFLLVPTAYITWIAPWVADMGIVFPLWLFSLLVVALGLVVLLIEYKMFTPSGFSFWSDQFWRHNNPLRAKLNKIEKNQKCQDKRLSAIEEMLKRIEKQKSSN